MTAVYRITTADPYTGAYTPQDGAPVYALGSSGLRWALRTLRSLAYEAHRGDPFVRVERIDKPLEGAA